jgi:endo-1,4-beta-xylanase
MMERRFFIRSLAKCGALAYVGRSLAVASKTVREPLRQRAKRRGLLFGSAALQRDLSTDATYAQLTAEQCAILVPEVELKWEMLRPAPEQYNFSPADWLLRFTKDHDMLFRGHTLVWHEAMPAWVARIAEQQNARQLLIEHVRTVVRHYAGEVHSWDVVNEIIEPADRRPDGLKDSLWLRLLGPEFIDIAFHEAQEADPKALLVWNENWLESNQPFSAIKRMHTLALLRQLKTRNVPVHVLGLQAHLHADVSLAPDFADFLKRIADLGVKVLITELDVVDKNLRAPVARRDQLVADRYYELLSSLLHTKAMIGAMTWGLSDRYSWLNRSPNYRRPDQLTSRGLPYDADLRPKPAWNVMAEIFDRADHR